MALSFALLLTLAYALLDPLGRRIRAAETRALAWSLPAEPSSGTVRAARALITRGWPSLVASELWLLLLLASLVVIFSFWWMAFVLPLAGLLLRALLDRMDPYPRHLGWYLVRLARQVEGALGEAQAEGDEARTALAEALLVALQELETRAGQEPVLA